MDVDTLWRRKRPVEDEEYLESKRYLSERFFNMRISQPQGGGIAAVPSVSQNSTATSRALTDDIFDAEVSMAEDPLSSHDEAPAGAPLTPSNDSVDTDDDDDLDDARKGSRTLPTILSFRQTAGSVADKRVDDWVRTSRQRMQADVSVASATDVCRALIPYKPLKLPGIEGDEAGGGNEGGGDPTPPPQSGGSDEDEAAVPTARAQLPARNEQSAGSSTAEAARATAGESAGGRHGESAGGRHGATVALFTPSQGICTSPSGADDAGGTMCVVSPRTTDGDAMEVASPGDEDAAAGGPWLSGPPTVEQIELTRVGSSRGAPTPELTPEWVAQVRHQAQDQGERAGGPSVKPLATESWRQW